MFQNWIRYRNVSKNINEKHKFETIDPIRFILFSFSQSLFNFKWQIYRIMMEWFINIFHRTSYVTKHQSALKNLKWRRKIWRKSLYIWFNKLKSGLYTFSIWYFVSGFQFPSERSVCLCNNFWWAALIDKLGQSYLIFSRCKRSAVGNLISNLFLFPVDIEKEIKR